MLPNAECGASILPDMLAPPGPRYVNTPLLTDGGGEKVTSEVPHERLVRVLFSMVNRAHFFGAVAKEMRRILVDYARARNAKKRHGERVRLSLADIKAVGTRPDEDLVTLDEALRRLEKLDPRASRVVELRFFTGLDEREAAEALGISVSTLKRDWQFARAWLFNELAPTDKPAG
jgi:RNA polymerase sigma factor (TIGR02999 family)